MEAANLIASSIFKTLSSIARDQFNRGVTRVTQVIIKINKNLISSTFVCRKILVTFGTISTIKTKPPTKTSVDTTIFFGRIKFGAGKGLSKPCIPKNNSCNEKPIGARKTCEDFNASMAGDCEDYYMYIPENETYLNCIKDKDYNCKKNIKKYYNKPCLNKEINIVNYDHCNFDYST